MVVLAPLNINFRMPHGYTLHLLIDVYDIESLAENNIHYMNESVLD